MVVQHEARSGGWSGEERGETEHGTSKLEGRSVSYMKFERGEIALHVGSNSGSALGVLCDVRRWLGEFGRRSVYSSTCLLCCAVLCCVVFGRRAKCGKESEAVGCQKLGSVLEAVRCF